MVEEAVVDLEVEVVVVVETGVTLVVEEEEVTEEVVAAVDEVAEAVDPVIGTAGMSLSLLTEHCMQSCISTLIRDSCDCSECGNDNFAWRDTCNRCKSTRSDGSYN